MSGVKQIESSEAIVFDTMKAEFEFSHLNGNLGLFAEEDQGHCYGNSVNTMSLSREQAVSLANWILVNVGGLPPQDVASVDKSVTLSEDECTEVQ